MRSDQNLRRLAAVALAGLFWAGAGKAIAQLEDEPVTPSAPMLTAAAAAHGATEPAVPIPSGWQPVDGIHRFGPDNLWDYINGADALFLDYGCQELLVQDIVRGDQAVTISLYDHGAPLNAFGILQRERGTGGESLDGVGAVAVLQPPYRGLMVKDRFYLKVDVSAGEADARMLADIMADIARQMPGDDSLPAELSLMPAEHRVPGSLAFTRRDFLGLAELRDCVHATYIEPESGSQYQLFALRPDERFLADPGSRWQAQDHDGARLLWRSIPYRGTVVMRGDESLLIGVAGLEDRDMALAVLDTQVIPGIPYDLRLEQVDRP